MILKSSIPWLLLAVGLLLARFVNKTSKAKQPFPPGPKGIPLIGNILQINSERPWITYSKWCRQHGTHPQAT